MALDTSIYGQIKQPEAPDFMGSLQKGMALSQLALQNRQLQQGAADQDAVRTALSKNIGPDGQVNRQGVLSDLARTAPMQAMDYQSKFAQQDVAQAEAKQKMLGDKINQMGMAAQMAMSAKDQGSYEQMKQQMQGMGLPTDHLPPQFDPTQMRSLALASLDQKQRLEAMAKTSEMDINQEKAPLERGKIAAETSKIQSETYKRNPDIMGQTDDPAKLVPGLVPKEHQAKAFAEIDAAENTRKMSQSILSSFEQAVKDTQGTGRVTSLVKDPRSAQALHQAMQPTFKDLEGTVRQAAMDNTFKNITPNPGDTASDIATKRQALQDYLQSKLSAPTARAYGIDLSKFPSTAPYASQGSKKSPSDSGVINSASASDDPPIRMVAPDGSIRMVPLSQKGEAIAAGGRVAK